MKYLVIRKWHEKIGVYIALFVVFLAISGIALNHTEKFKLNTTYVKLDWLLDLYQINPESEPIEGNENVSFSTPLITNVVFVGFSISFNNKGLETKLLVSIPKFEISFLNSEISSQSSSYADNCFVFPRLI